MSLFRKDASGNIAILFAIAILPILGFVGAATDYATMNSLRSKIQGALDSALLAGAIAGKLSLDSGAGKSTAIAAANDAAARFFSGNTVGITANLSTSFKMNGMTLSGTGSASSTVPTTFMKVMGNPSMSFTVASQTTSRANPIWMSTS